MALHTRWITCAGASSARRSRRTVALLPRSARSSKRRRTRTWRRTCWARRRPRRCRTGRGPRGEGEEGRKKSRKRIEGLFGEGKETYPLFSARDELTLSDRALAFIVGEIAPYNLTGTDADVKGIAYQELVGDNLRGDRGQY